MALLTGGLRVYKLTVEEIETMLACRFGCRIKPVNKVALTRLKITQKIQAAQQISLLARKKP